MAIHLIWGGTKSQPIAYTAYQKLAQSYADLAPTKDYNAYYDRPATISLLDGLQAIPYSMQDVAPVFTPKYLFKDRLPSRHWM